MKKNIYISLILIIIYNNNFSNSAIDKGKFFFSKLCKSNVTHIIDRKKSSAGTESNKESYRTLYHDCTCGVLQQRRARIYDGDIVSSRQNYPWLAQIIMKHLINSVLVGRECVGALITMLHMLSAAHCFTQRYRSGYALLSDERKHKIGQIILHDDFFENTPRPRKIDIAISLLKKRVKLGYLVGPICLPTEDEDFTDAIATAAGWGWLDAKGTDTEDLRKVDLPILSNEVCNKESKWPWAIPDYMFCAGYMEGGPDTCIGDSGAPLMVAGKNDEIIVAGVVSYGEGCGKPYYPGLNMKVSTYIPWIKKQIGNEHICSRP